MKAKRAQSVHDDESWKEGGVAPTLNGFDNNSESRATVIAFGIRSDATRDGVAKTPSADAEGRIRLRNPGLGISEELAPTLDTGQAHIVASVQTFVFQPADKQGGPGAITARLVEVAPPLLAADGSVSDRGLRIVEPAAHIAPTLTAANDPSRSPQSSEVTQQVAAVQAAGMGVRRLTPCECERLMGWPDDHTRYSADGTEIADSARYRMCGNGVAAPVAKYVAECIGAIL